MYIPLEQCLNYQMLNMRYGFIKSGHPRLFYKTPGSLDNIPLGQLKSILIWVAKPQLSDLIAILDPRLITDLLVCEVS